MAKMWLPLFLITLFVFLVMLSSATPMPKKHKPSRDDLKTLYSAPTAPCQCEEGCSCKELHGDDGPCSCVTAQQKAALYCICDSSCPCKIVKCSVDNMHCPCRLQVKLSQKTRNPSRTEAEHQQEILLEQRANALLNAWKDTLQNRMLNTTDINVMYDMWYSNMARRGLAPLYATHDVFQASMPFAMKQQLTLAHAKTILSPYIGKENVKCNPKPVFTTCQN
jgi:hypothetical protein